MSEEKRTLEEAWQATSRSATKDFLLVHQLSGQPGTQTVIKQLNARIRKKAERMQEIRKLINQLETVYA